MSNVWPRNALNQSLCIKRALFILLLFALRLASATASGKKSTPITDAWGNSLASASAMAPVPVPKSQIDNGGLFGVLALTLPVAQLITCSTNTSVSGRGISV